MRSEYLDSAPLTPGDTVRLIAPAGPADEDSLQRAVSRLESWGLNVVPGTHIRARHPRVSYLAGTDDQRRTDLVEAWCDPAASAVIALRGGYGAMRLLDGLDFAELSRHGLRPDGRPKLLTGSSDITALHQAWHHHLGIATLFCPMPGNAPFKDSDVVPAEVASWLFEPWGGRELGFPECSGEAGSRTKESDDQAPPRTGTSSPSTKPAAEDGVRSVEGRPTSRARTLVPGTAAGRLVGGNLSLIAAGMGSAELSGAGEPHASRGPRIVMLEDVDEELYRLDNLLVQLVRGGWFASAEAVVLGSWIDCAPIDEIEALVLDFLGDAGMPIVSEMGFGHDPDAPSAPLGVDVRLEAPAGGRPRMQVER